MRAPKPVIQTYLDRHAESDCRLMSTFPADISVEHVLVLPCFDETFDCLTRLKQHPENNILAIVVINQPSNTNTSETNQHFYNQAITSGKIIWNENHLTLIDWKNQNYCLLVDRFTNDQTPERQIPEKQGVGLARKIGCDIAVHLINKAVIGSQFIHTSDADAHLPTDYFQQALPDSSVSAYVYSYAHQCDNSDIGRATALYEQSLGYYEAGLSWAGSPYAFGTIGSCIAVSALHYCQARGFPKRSGGEDFYLLNKLAKLGTVAPAAGQPISIEARLSQRVPFGTGPAVEKIMALANPEEVMDYNPQCFIALRETIASFKQLADCKQQSEINEWFSLLPIKNRSVLTSINVNDLLIHLSTQVGNANAQQRLQHIHSWFDAFKTLKFLHALQAQRFPKIKLTEALKEFNKIKIL